MLKSKTIIIGVSGGIACYKILDLVSLLKKKGYIVHVVMTHNATKFINPLTFRTISENPVLTNTFDDPLSHIDIPHSADVFLIAPASFNIIGKIANGIADDLLSTMISACTCRKIMAPAMNANMYNNPALQDNISILKKRGYEIIEPEEGLLACGYNGIGRLKNIEGIINHILNDNDKPLLGKKVLITAGGTIEYIDPVRFISNKSSGRMGIALAQAAHNLGADVSLVYANVSVPLPDNINLFHVDSANSMLNVLRQKIDSFDILIMASAVSDFRVESVSTNKIKKKSGSLILKLIQNDDILKSLNKNKKQTFIGFSAETNNLINNAKHKLVNKNLDLIIANDVSNNEIGFNSKENEVTLLFADGQIINLPRKDKYELSMDILKLIHKHLIPKS